MSYGLLGLQNRMEGQGLQGVQQAANAQRQRDHANEQLKQAERQQTMSNVGAGAAIGMTVGPLGAAVGAGAGFLVSKLF